MDRDAVIAVASFCAYLALTVLAVWICAACGAQSDYATWSGIEPPTQGGLS